MGLQDLNDERQALERQFNFDCKCAHGQEAALQAHLAAVQNDLEKARAIIQEEVEEAEKAQLEEELMDILRQTASSDAAWQALADVVNPFFNDIDEDLLTP